MTRKWWYWWIVLDIAYGSRVYIRHIATRGGYLHSHPHDYPTGSKRKCYLTQRIEEIDTEMCIQNNKWHFTPIVMTIIGGPSTRRTQNRSLALNMSNMVILYVLSTMIPTNAFTLTIIDLLWLTWIITMKSGNNEKQVYKEQKADGSLSTYGFPGFDGDANDYWRVEIVDHDKHDPESKDRLRTLHSKFRLVHVLQNCALFSHSVKLPEWGWGQQEVTCIKNGKKPKTMWYIESTENALCMWYYAMTVWWMILMTLLVYQCLLIQNEWIIVALDSLPSLWNWTRSCGMLTKVWHHRILTILDHR